MMKRGDRGCCQGSKGSAAVWCAVVVVLAAVMVIGLTGCGKEEEKTPEKPVARPIKMLTINAAGDVLARELPGRTRAAIRVDLAFKVSGPLIELPVDEGQTVARGALIARILPRDFKTAVDKATALALEAEQQFQRYKELYVRNQVSKADLDRFKSDRDVTRAQKKGAEDALEDTNLRAPFAGIIAKRFVENFEEVRAKQPIVKLQDVSDIEILVDVPEETMLQVKQTGAFKAHAEFSAAPGKRYPLTLKEYSTEADPTTQTYQVTLLMKQPDDIQIFSGMTAIVRGGKAESDTADGAIFVPAIAVTTAEGGGSHVWVVDRKTMTVHRKPVTIGEARGPDRIQVIDGIQSGETIAISAISRLQEGMAVSEMPKY